MCLIFIYIEYILPLFLFNSTCRQGMLLCRQSCVFNVCKCIYGYSRYRIYIVLLFDIYLCDRYTYVYCHYSWEREIMLFIGKPIRRSKMISNATNTLIESRKESLLRCAGSTSICVWLACDLVVMCVQAVGDRALGDLCVCVRCGSVQSQKVWICCNRVRYQGGSC